MVFRTACRALLRATALLNRTPCTQPLPSPTGVSQPASAKQGLAVLLSTNLNTSARAVWSLSLLPHAHAEDRGEDRPRTEDRPREQPSGPVQRTHRGADGAAKGNDKASDDVEKELEALVAFAYKTLLKMGFGGVMGVCVGMAAKQVTRTAMTAVGLQFLVLQLMAAHGLIDIKWDRIKAALCHLIGVEQEGQFSPRDLNATTFLPGFLYGWNL